MQLVGIHEQPDVIRIIAFIDGLDDVLTISFILLLLLCIMRIVSTLLLLLLV